MTTHADRLRAAAARLQRQIDQKRNPATARLNPTPRRARIIASMEREADRLEAVQRVLDHLADLADAGELPALLARVNSAAAVQLLTSWGPTGKLPAPDGWAAHERAKLARMGIDTEAKLAAAWEAVEHIYKARRAPTASDRVRAMERELIGVPIAGFVPTPAPLADRVVAEANIPPRSLVLEPSAGKGDLVDAILRASATSQVVAVEIVPRLVSILEARFGPHAERVSVRPGDFLALPPAPVYDRVVMNPPFERGADRAHVLHALGFLARGGRLVSIMGGMALDGRGGDAFRAELDARCAWWRHVRLPEGAFQGPCAFRQTGVRALLLTAQVP